MLAWMLSEYESTIVIRFKLFTLKYDMKLAGFDDSSVRRFLADKQLLRVDEQFFEHAGVPHIALLLVYSFEGGEFNSRSSLGEKNKVGEWLEQEGQVNEKLFPAVPLKKRLRELSESDRLCYDSLREWRREKAQSEGIPVYLVASNSMLLDVVLNRPESLQKLQEINGFGEGKVKKFGSELIAFFMREKTGHDDE